MQQMKQTKQTMQLKFPENIELKALCKYMKFYCSNTVCPNSKNVFVQIAKCICPNCKICLYKDALVQYAGRYMCPNQ